MFNAISPTTNIYMYMYITETLNWYCNYLFFLKKVLMRYWDPITVAFFRKIQAKFSIIDLMDIYF